MGRRAAAHTFTWPGGVQMTRPFRDFLWSLPLICHVGSQKGGEKGGEEGLIETLFFFPIFNVKGEDTLKKEIKEEIIQDLSMHLFLRNHHKPLHMRT